MTIPIYSQNVADFPWYHPAPLLLKNLSTHVSIRWMIEHTQRWLITHRTDSLGGWYK